MTRKTSAAVAVETPEYVSMLCRMVRAAGRRVADGDPEDLALLRQVQAELDAAVTAGVRGMRENSGRSWSEIGRALGVTKQAASKRWGAPQLAPVVDPGDTRASVVTPHGPPATSSARRFTW